MKIVMGKFSSAPFHALSKKDVSFLLKLVPAERVKHVSSVILSSKIFKKIKLAKPVEYTTTSKQLSIFSRGLVREDIARQVLLELVSIGDEHKEDSSVEIEVLEKVIKPYMDKFLKARI